MFKVVLMNGVWEKREIKDYIEGLKKHLDTLENDELIKIYEKEILLKSLELEEIKLRIMLVL